MKSQSITDAIYHYKWNTIMLLVIFIMNVLTCISYLKNWQGLHEVLVILNVMFIFIITIGSCFWCDVFIPRLNQSKKMIESGNSMMHKIKKIIADEKDETIGSDIKTEIIRYETDCDRQLTYYWYNSTSECKVKDETMFGFSEKNHLLDTNSDYRFKGETLLKIPHRTAFYVKVGDETQTWIMLSSESEKTFMTIIRCQYKRGEHGKCKEMDRSVPVALMSGTKITLRSGSRYEMLIDGKICLDNKGFYKLFTLEKDTEAQLVY